MLTPAARRRSISAIDVRLVGTRVTTRKSVAENACQLLIGRLPERLADRRLQRPVRSRCSSSASCSPCGWPLPPRRDSGRGPT